MTPGKNTVKEINPGVASMPKNQSQMMKREKSGELGMLVWHNVEYCNGY
jgi:hypothetical protein